MTITWRILLLTARPAKMSMNTMDRRAGASVFGRDCDARPATRTTSAGAPMKTLTEARIRVIVGGGGEKPAAIYHASAAK
jgi:hypothetical protein